MFSLLVGGFFVWVVEPSGASAGTLPERSKPQGGSPDLKPARSGQAALESDQFVWRSAGLRVDKRERFTAWLSNGLEVVSQLVLGGDAGVPGPHSFWES